MGPGFPPLRACGTGECGALGLTGGRAPVLAQPRPAPTTRPRGRSGRLAVSSVARPGPARPAEPSSVAAWEESRKARVFADPQRPGGGAGVAPGVGGRAGPAPVLCLFLRPGACRDPSPVLWHSPPSPWRPKLCALPVPSAVTCRAAVFGCTACHVPGTRPLTSVAPQYLRGGECLRTGCTTLPGFESRPSQY